MIHLTRQKRNWLLKIFIMVFTQIWPDCGFAQGAKPAIKAKPKSKSNALANKRESASGINDFSSKNFSIHTDLSVSDAHELLEKLEKMLDLVTQYYGKPNADIIEMNVVQQKARWLPGMIPEDAVEMIEHDAGITLSMTTSRSDGFGAKEIVAAKSIVWTVSTRGVPQHEAIHAYCHQNFGRTGPTWYAEGMAELGKYWREKDVSIQIDDEVMKYLKNSEPKGLTEITASGQKTGDSWQNYAWRWALCHLLSTNPNYSPRFKPLGMALLGGQSTSFEDVYGPMAKEISFEYQFFLRHMDQGFRADLCAWDWKTKFQRIRGSTTAQAKILANRGWQASRVMLKTGDKISYSTSGEWSLQKDGPKIGPDGDEVHKGQLIGILFDDYQLSEPFDLGADGTYEASSDGNLFVRCRDEWNSIADNSGAVIVKWKSAN